MIPRSIRLWLVAGLTGATLPLSAQTPSAAPEAGDPAAPATPAPGAPAPIPTTDEEMIPSLRLADAPLDLVLQTIEMWSGRVILRPQALPTPNFTITINKPMPKSEAMLALETLLNLNQIGLVPMGDKFLKVVPLPSARTETPELIEGSSLDLPPSGRIVTKLFQLEFLRVNEFLPQINPLLNPNLGGPVLFDKTNAALITDSVSTVQRIEMLLKKLDQPMTAGMTPKFYTLRFAKASDLVNKMRTILQGTLQMQLGAATTFSPDDRTNQIILISDPRQHTFFDDLIAKLDVKADPNTRNEVIPLKHAAAKDVATLLSSLVSGQNKVTSQGTSVRPGQLPPPPQVNGGPQPEPSQPNALAGEFGSTNEFSSLLTILPDERTNSVVISGTVDDIRLTKELIDKIDKLLPQVRIEVVIAEVTLNDNDVSGLQALSLTFGQSNGTSKPNVTRITNFTGTVAGVDIASGVVNPLSFVASLQDTGSRNNVKVLSAPTIMATHAKEAEIVVGNKYPYAGSAQSTPVSTTTTPTGGTNPVSTPGYSSISQAQFADITIDLKVTPLIGDDGSIQLKIDQKVDDLINTVPIAGLGDVPNIGHRQATSFVNVQDGHMLILGGLQRNRDSKSRTKLGFLHEIPVISQIFGHRNNAVDRTELLLFIRPVIIKPEDGTNDANKTINGLSNKDQINQYLNPAPPPPPKKKSGWFHHD